MKIVLGTNVLVSALLKPRSDPAKILRLIFQGDVSTVINEHILAEYHEVLKREKFSFNQKEVEQVLEVLRSYGIRAPALLNLPTLPDPDDTPFLEAAVSVGADALVTGNKKHFPKRNCGDVRVLLPSEFLSRRTQ